MHYPSQENATCADSNTTDMYKMSSSFITGAYTITTKEVILLDGVTIEINT